MLWLPPYETLRTVGPLNSSCESNLTASSTDWPAKHDLFGLLVSAVEYDQAIECILHAVEHGDHAVISCHAVHAIVTLSSDSDLCAKANQFAMITPDGQPVRWALNSLYKTGLQERVYGPELMRRLLQSCAAKGLSVYLYGGSETTLQKLRGEILLAHPNLRIAGAQSPPFRELSDEEMDAVAEEINQAGADIVFIGLGCPKQDRFAAAQAGRIHAVQVCVGAAFDFHAKSKPMAPTWMQKHGLEWLFRLICEPRRLLGRYLTTNTTFLLRLLRAHLRRPRSY